MSAPSAAAHNRTLCPLSAPPASTAALSPVKLSGASAVRLTPSSAPAACARKSPKPSPYLADQWKPTQAFHSSANSSASLAKKNRLGRRSFATARFSEKAASPALSLAPATSPRPTLPTNGSICVLLTMPRACSRVSCRSSHEQGKPRLLLPPERLDGHRHFCRRHLHDARPHRRPQNGRFGLFRLCHPAARPHHFGDPLSRPPNRFCPASCGRHQPRPRSPLGCHHSRHCALDFSDLGRRGDCHRPPIRTHLSWAEDSESDGDLVDSAPLSDLALVADRQRPPPRQAPIRRLGRAAHARGRGAFCRRRHIRFGLQRPGGLGYERSAARFDRQPSHRRLAEPPSLDRPSRRHF